MAPSHIISDTTDRILTETHMLYVVHVYRLELQIVL